MRLKLASAEIEREVEDAYNGCLAFYFPKAAITHPYACDGLLETDVSGKLLKLVIEYKLDEKLSDRASRARVLAQVLFYLKRFEDDGSPLPNVCMVADRNECFVMRTGPLVKRLSEKWPWELAPSSAGTLSGLVLEIAEDDEVNPFVFEMSDGMDFGQVAEKIRDCAGDVPRYVKLTEKNFRNVYRYFREKVLKDKKATSSQAAAAFVGVAVDPENFYRHPAKKNTLVVPGGQMAIDGRAFDAFFSHFERKYSPAERTKFTEIADRLIDDEERRRHGDFFTPTEFVDLAHSMITEWLGPDWREKYVVWDPAAGTLNLTRDYRFGELYCSTLKQEELDMADKYNREAVKFQFDFLNDPYEKLPEGLRKAIEGNSDILVFMNPPYATACDWDSTSSNKAGVASNSNTADEMRRNGFGGCSEALHGQFLYRLMQLKKRFSLTSLKLAFFCNPVFLTGPKYAKFRKEWNSLFRIHDGILFQASWFDACSDKWGITFNLWEDGFYAGTEYPHRLVSKDQETLGPFVSGETKTLYSTDGRTPLSTWVREPVKGLKTCDLPNVSSGITVKDSDTVRGSGVRGEVGYLYFNSNSVQKNAQSVGMFSTPLSAGNGLPVTPANFDRCVQGFSVRKLIDHNWINDKDEYMAPSMEDPEFVNDSLVYSLFHSASQQSSLRNVEYHGKRWDIPNEFFWIPRDRMMELADEHGNDECYNDARTSKDRYVAGLVKSRTFSAEAKAVLDMATLLVEESFGFRPLFDESHPEYQVSNWDAGWYQVKAVLKEHLPERLAAFRELYGKLADKMRPKVYELGFLRR